MRATPSQSPRSPCYRDRECQVAGRVYARVPAAAGDGTSELTSRPDVELSVDFPEVVVNRLWADVEMRPDLKIRLSLSCGDGHLALARGQVEFIARVPVFARSGEFDSRSTCERL